ncbi:Aste57867_2072 [Aphanomyces stellatus]|uniref:Aste57867_2072 protein n=1 Tax=Aphanomyces stellatus TaxID=120398 RepID=A0A485KB06_9STRA|nr:hypothetical protein As57867_002068 [Aphanomyces stellatus]VFT79275.1 Aste57867_2072 [Aphanomyces stellatus]
MLCCCLGGRKPEKDDNDDQPQAAPPVDRRTPVPRASAPATSTTRSPATKVPSPVVPPLPTTLVAPEDVHADYVEIIEEEAARALSFHTAAAAAVDDEPPMDALSVLEAHRLSKPLVLLEQVLGRGTYGEVVLGHYDDQLVAVKRLRPDHNTPKNVDSLIQEIDLMTRFNSPYLVHFIGATWTTDMTDLTCVVEYMEQRDLQSYLTKTKGRPLVNFPWKHKMAVARNMALALVYLHDQKVIHRDLKSPNVFLNQKMEAKLGDFGIARHVVEKSMSNAVGTYRWTAPEVLKGKYYSVKADIYSFGMVLSELDTHEVPYHGMVNSKGQEFGNFTIMFQVMNGKIKPTFTDKCPPWLHALALRCIAFDPASRPTAQEIVAEIEHQQQQIN